MLKLKLSEIIQINNKKNKHVQFRTPGYANVRPKPYTLLAVSFTFRCLAISLYIRLKQWSLIYDQRSVRKKQKNCFSECGSLGPCSADHSHN